MAHRRLGRGRRRYGPCWRAGRAAAGFHLARDGAAALGQERGAPAVDPVHELRLRRRRRQRPAAPRRRPRGPAARRDEEVEPALAVAVRSGGERGGPSVAAPFLSERVRQGGPAGGRRRRGTHVRGGVGRHGGRERGGVVTVRTRRSELAALA